MDGWVWIIGIINSWNLKRYPRSWQNIEKIDDWRLSPNALILEIRGTKREHCKETGKAWFVAGGKREKQYSWNQVKKALIPVIFSWWNFCVIYILPSFLSFSISPFLPIFHISLYSYLTNISWEFVKCTMVVNSEFRYCRPWIRIVNSSLLDKSQFSQTILLHEEW